MAKDKDTPPAPIPHQPASPSASPPHQSSASPAPAPYQMPKAPESPAAPPHPTPPADELAALKAQVARLEALVTANAVNAVGVVQAEKSKAEQKALQEHIEKGKQQITQDEADRQFPGGRFRWVCVLPDGNDHPRVVISADNEVDAAARYCAVCGVTSSEKRVTVERA